MYILCNDFTSTMITACLLKRACSSKCPLLDFFVCDVKYNKFVFNLVQKENVAACLNVNVSHPIWFASLPYKIKVINTTDEKAKVQNCMIVSTRYMNCVVTKTWNHPRPAKTSHNKPKPTWQSRNITQTAMYANITQTGRIKVYCGWFWVVLAGSMF